jgi:hypothetical protein
MARAEAVVNIFRGFKDFIHVWMLKKNAENLGFLGSFPFTLRERSRMMRMSVPKESLVLRAMYMGNQKQLKGELWQS